MLTLCRPQTQILRLLLSSSLDAMVAESKGLLFVEAPKESQYPEPIIWRLKRQLYGLSESPIPWQSQLTRNEVRSIVFHWKGFFRKGQSPCHGKCR